MVTPLQEFATPRVARPVIPTTKMASSGHYKGHGSPEGVIPAAIGADYLDRNTGDTWRKLTDDLKATGWAVDEDSDSLVTATGSTTPRSAADRWGEEINVKDYGAIGNGVIDDTDAIEAALAVGSNKIVKLPPGIFVISRTLPIKRGVRLVGSGSGGGYPFQQTTANPSLAAVLATGQSVIFLAAGSDCPMFENEAADGEFLRTTNSVNDGRGSITQYDYNASFENLTFHANARSQSSGVYNADVFTLLDAWNITFLRCRFISPAGYFIRAWNCNMITVHECVMSGDGQRTKGILFYDTADSQISDLYEGAAIGPAIWFSTSTTWLNHVTTAHIGDSRNGDTGGLITSITDDVITLSRDPSLNTGDPFIFYTRSQDAAPVLPATVVSGQTYFWIRLTATTGKFATTLPAALAGAGDTIIDTGTDAWVMPGPNSCLLLTEASKNTFTAIRYDNGEGVGVELINASRNQFIGAYILRPGFNDGGSQLPRIGLRIRSGSDNKFSGLTIDTAYQPIRVDDGTNYSGSYTELSKTINSTFTGTFEVGATKNASTGALSVGKISGIPASGEAFQFSATSATIGLMSRTSGVVASTAFRISATQDGSNRGGLILADGATFAGLALFSGDASLAEWVVGQDGLATPQTQRIRGGVKSGTNVAGDNLDIVAPGGTGTGASGKLRFYVTALKPSGTTPHNVYDLGFTVETAKIDFSKPAMPPRLTKAQRDALTPENGMIVYQTDNTPGIRTYENGAWVAYTATADP